LVLELRNQGNLKSWAGPNKGVWGISANGYYWEDGQGKSGAEKLETRSKVSIIVDYGNKKAPIKFKVGKNIYKPPIVPSEKYHLVMRLQKSSVEWSQE